MSERLSLKRTELDNMCYQGPTSPNNKELWNIGMEGNINFIQYAM